MVVLLYNNTVTDHYVECVSLLCPQVALVYGQMNEPPGARARVALTGLTVAEYFRDKEGQDVLLFIDNIFRYMCVCVCVCGCVGVCGCEERF